MNKKILLIQPTIYDEHGEPVKKSKLYFVGLGMPLLAALLPAGVGGGDLHRNHRGRPLGHRRGTWSGSVGMGHAANRAKDIAAEFRSRGKTRDHGWPRWSAWSPTWPPSTATP